MKRLFKSMLLGIGILMAITTVVYANVYLNEFLPDPSVVDDTLGEWVEVINLSSLDIDLNGWVLVDAANHKLFITSDYTDGTTIATAGGFLVIKRNKSTFSLNNPGDTIFLYDGDPILSGQLIDIATYSGSITDRSWARIPDGTGDWQADQPPTPGDYNQPTPTPTPSPTDSPTPTASPSPSASPTPTVTPSFKPWPQPPRPPTPPALPARLVKPFLPPKLPEMPSWMRLVIEFFF